MANKCNARNDYFNIRAGRPPVTLWLAQRIESGVFKEMADLLPERLGDKEEEQALKTITQYPGMGSMFLHICSSSDKTAS